MPEEVDSDVTEACILPLLQVLENLIHRFGLEYVVVLVAIPGDRRRRHPLVNVLGCGLDPFTEPEEHPERVELTLECDRLDAFRAPHLVVVELAPGDVVHVFQADFVTPVNELFETVSLILE